MNHSSCDKLHELILENIDKAGFDELNLLINNHCKTCPECKKYSPNYNSMSERFRRKLELLRYYKRFANMKSVHKVLFYGADLVLIVLAYILLGHSCDKKENIMYESGYSVQFEDTDVFSQMKDSIDLLKDSYLVYDDATVKMDELHFAADGSLLQVDYRVITAKYIFFVNITPNIKGTICTIRYNTSDEQSGDTRFESFDNLFSNMDWNSFERSLTTADADYDSFELNMTKTISDADTHNNQYKYIVRYKDGRSVISNDINNAINHTAIVITILPSIDYYLLIMD